MKITIALAAVIALVAPAVAQNASDANRILLKPGDYFCISSDPNESYSCTRVGRTDRTAVVLEQYGNGTYRVVLDMNNIIGYVHRTPWTPPAQPVRSPQQRAYEWCEALYRDCRAGSDPLFPGGFAGQPRLSCSTFRANCR